MLLTIKDINIQVNLILMSSSEQSFNEKISSSEELTPNSNNNKDEHMAIQNMEKVSTGSKEECTCGQKSNNMMPCLATNHLKNE